MRRACRAAGDELAAGKEVLHAVRAAVIVLEDAPETNAGKGSNLNIEGAVECDAAVMDGDGTCGAVGAVPGLPNPISAACLLALESRKPLPHGLVRPVLLVGDAARTWASKRGVSVAATSEAADRMLITNAARKRHAKYMAILDGGLDKPPQLGASHNGDDKVRKRRRCEEKDAALDENDGDDAFLHDTVGCIVIDAWGRVAAGVSSGGVALKAVGRVGEAAMLGAGCWAAAERDDTPAIAVSVTGVGERIMRHLVARETAAVASFQPTQSLETCMATVLRNTVATGPLPRECGVIGARAKKTNGRISVEVGVSMCAARSLAVGWLVEGTKGGSSMQDTLILRRKDVGDASECIGLELGTSWEVPAVRST